MPDWDAVHEYLQPKAPLYCPEEPSLTQKVFLRTNAKEALFGGAAGGGKSSALLMAGLQYVDVPGYTAIFFRRTFADLALPQALMDRFLEWIEPYRDEIKWNANNFTATFPSGARITFGYLNNKDDYLRYKGAEFQFVGMDEVTEIREEDYRYLFSRMRRPLTGPLSKVPLRMRAASNPAPNWVRQRFIVEGKEKGRIFVPSKLEDNPGIEKESYKENLKELSQVEMQQLLNGEWWASTTGDLFSREDFTIIEPEEVPTFLSPKVVRFWDLASTKPHEGNRDPDWTAGVLMVYENGVAYILDVTRDRQESPEIEDLIQKTAADDGLGVPIRIEKEGGASGKIAMNNYARKVVPGFDFDGVPATGDKVTRARPLASANRNGNLKLVRGPWNSDFIDELCAFQTDGKGLAHDDQVDAAAHAFAEVTGIAGKVRRKVKVIV